MRHVTLVGMLALMAVTMTVAADRRPVGGTIWTANRGANSIRGFDAATGTLVRTVPMAPGSQTGDLAYAKGKLYVTEEFGTPPAVAVVDPFEGQVLYRITFPAGARPHHIHASNSGTLIAVGLFGTDLVAVIDTSDDTLLGAWDSNPATSNGRVHAAVFSQDGNTLYLANEGAGELIAMDPRSGIIAWHMSVPAIHEIAITHDDKRAYVSRRTANRLALVNLEEQTYTDILTLGLPDSLQLSADQKLLTVGLRTSPAQLAVVDTNTLAVALVSLSALNETSTIAGHQWTSPSGRYTFAAFEGGAHPGVAVIDHQADNDVVERLEYSGRPHGVDHVPGPVK